MRDMSDPSYCANSCTHHASIQTRLAVNDAIHRIANIFSKLQVNDRTQAILYALRKGLVTLRPEDPA